ncbi:MAG: hypothetical protein R3F56_03595 [Planctomycetota bacterium]
MAALPPITGDTTCSVLRVAWYLTRDVDVANRVVDASLVELVDVWAATAEDHEAVCEAWVRCLLRHREVHQSVRAIGPHHLALPDDAPRPRSWLGRVQRLVEHAARRVAREPGLDVRLAESVGDVRERVWHAAVKARDWPKLGRGQRHRKTWTPLLFRVKPEVRSGLDAVFPQHAPTILMRRARAVARIVDTHEPYVADAFDELVDRCVEEGSRIGSDQFVTLLDEYYDTVKAVFDQVPARAAAAYRIYFRELWSSDVQFFRSGKEPPLPDSRLRERPYEGFVRRIAARALERASVGPEQIEEVRHQLHDGARAERIVRRVHVGAMAFVLDGLDYARQPCVIDDVQAFSSQGEEILRSEPFQNGAPLDPEAEALVRDLRERVLEPVRAAGLALATDAESRARSSERLGGVLCSACTEAAAIAGRASDKLRRLIRSLLGIERGEALPPGLEQQARARP